MIRTIKKMTAPTAIWAIWTGIWICLARSSAMVVAKPEPNPPPRLPPYFSGSIMA